MLKNNKVTLHHGVSLQWGRTALGMGRQARYYQSRRRVTVPTAKMLYNETCGRVERLFWHHPSPSSTRSWRQLGGERSFARTQRWAWGGWPRTTMWHSWCDGRLEPEELDREESAANDNHAETKEEGEELPNHQPAGKWELQQDTSLLWWVETGKANKNNLTWKRGFRSKLHEARIST